MLLTHSGCRGLGSQLDQSVRTAIGNGHTTRDLGGTLDTKQFVDEVCRGLH